MESRKTFWFLVSILFAVTIYFLIGKFSRGWTVGYFLVVILASFLVLFFRGAFHSSEQQESAEHMVDYSPKKEIV